MVNQMNENKDKVKDRVEPTETCGHCGRKVSHVDDYSGWCDVCEEAYREQQNAWADQDAREDF